MKEYVYKKKYSFVIVLYILLLGLIPLLWFKNDQLITGTDVNFPPFPKDRMEERFYTWHPYLFAGAERSTNIGSLTYTGTPGVISYVVDDVVLVEKITYVLWFTLTGFSISYLLGTLFSHRKEDEKFILKLFGITLYMVNFYNVFLWVRLQVTVTSLVFVPILFALLHKSLNNKKLRPVDLLLLSVATVLGGPLTNQPPIMYVIILSMFIYIFLYLFKDLVSNRKVLFSKVKKLLVIACVVIGTGIYWMLPLGNYVFGSGLIDDKSTAVDAYNIESLLEWTSKTSSNLNIFRMYGDVVWFDSWGEQYYFPEFVEMLNNSFFDVLGMLIVLTIFLALHVNRNEKKNESLVIISFGIITLVSLFFSKGLHPPFEAVFEWSFKNLPGFWIHRAPWQKFGFITTLGYAILGSLGALYVSMIIHKKYHLSKYVTVAALISLYLLFNNLFVLGKMFPSKDSAEGYHGHYNFGFHHTFPDYLYKSRDYIQSLPEENYNIMVLPDQHTTAFEWGYGSATYISWIFLQRSVIATQYGEGYALDGYMSDVYRNIVNALYAGNTESLSSVLDFYNIRFILQRNDFASDFFNDYDNPEFIKQKMEAFDEVDINSIGLWDFYDFSKTQNNSLIYLANYFIDATNMEDIIMLPVMLNTADNMVILENVPDTVSFNEEYHSTMSGGSASTTDFELEPATIPNASVDPNNFLYVLVKIRERVQSTVKAKDPVAKADVHLWLAAKRAVEITEYNLDSQTTLQLTKDLTTHFRSYMEILSSVNAPHEHAKLAAKGLQTINTIETINPSLVANIKTTLATEITKLTSITTSYEENICDLSCYEFYMEKEGTYDLYSLDSNYSLLEVAPSTIEAVSNASKLDEDTFLLKPGKVRFTYNTQANESVTVEDKGELSVETFRQELDTDNTRKLINGIAIDNVRKMTARVPDYNSTYTVNIEYMTPVRTGVAIIQESFDGLHKLQLYSDVLEPTNGTKILNHEVTTSNGVEYLHIYFYAVEKGMPTVQSVDITRIVRPNLVLRKNYSISVNAEVPSLRFVKINPTKYIVELDSNTPIGEFALVFNQTYSPHWKLYGGTGVREQNLLSGFETLKLDSISNDRHYKSNYFSNAWLVNPDDLKDIDYLIIEFTSQRTFYISAILSVLTLSSLSIIVLFDYISKFKSKFSKLLKKV